MQQAPDISVIIASFSGSKALRRCLESLEKQWDRAGGVEVIVPTDVDLVASAHLSERFPTVRFILAPKGTSVFRLRTLGVQVARGRIVAISEDHVTFSENWLAAILRGFAEGHEIVGGPIDNGRDTLYDWALFACEYITFMPPQGKPTDGPAGVLSGVNVAYKFSLLEKTRRVWQETFHENEVHDALLKEGHSLYCAGEAVVSSHLVMPLRHGMEHLFGGGRHYGRYRKGHVSASKRLLLPVGVPLVPAVLVWRILRAVLARRPGRLGTILLGMPYIACLIGAWTAGEMLGYLLPLPEDREPVGCAPRTNAIENQRSSDPHPSPLPAYRAREQEPAAAQGEVR